MSSNLPSMQAPNSLAFSHMGFYVRDLEAMASFYKSVLRFTETDRGDLGPVQLVFLSRDPNEHHQLVLASGRPADLSFNVVNQISFKVPSLTELRRVLERAQANGGASDIQPATHGNAISLYLRDPEGNRLEIYLDTPWYCEQPLRQALDLAQSDEVIWAQVEALARSRPKFQSRAQWSADLARKMALTEAL